MSSRHYCPECDQRLGDNTWWCKSCQQRHFKENFDNWTTGDEDIDDFIRITQMNAEECDQYLEWIPFSAFINVNKSEISEVGTLFSANWIKGPTDVWDPVEGEYAAKRSLLKVALTSLGSSPSLFLKELKIHYYSRTRNGLVMRLFGVTRESVTSNLMMVAETVEWDVRHYVSHHHTRLTWQNKLAILHTIASALEIVKNENQVQGEFANQNSNVIKSYVEVSVNELGLGEGKELIPVIGHYRYDLLPFFAPEIISGEDYNSKVDIYTFGMLMWEFSSNRPPFYDQPHDAKLINNICNGLRPKFRDDTPECYGELMQRCWSPYAQDRPTISEIVKILNEWHVYGKNKDHFVNAESKRIKRVLAKGLNPNPVGRMVAPPKIHPQAIYTSRLLKFPALPIPRNSPIPTPRRSQSLSEHDFGRTQMSSQDLAAILIRDESFFSTALLMQRRSVYPEEVPEPEDEDILKQYEFSIPYDIEDIKSNDSTSSEKNTKSLSILTDVITEEPESSEELFKSPITNCASPINFKIDK
ncbi:kinase-like domain-containing protein [Rhizophagus clarus]|uniref:Kinase-like domain-containing protein n=1 Tax=Rhizophagus clarus TaxID=94130 RepID=A0A8H3LT26_9GLOM|nr:kinase-like domain-containing protein [Rhizophagus clarus]